MTFFLDCSNIRYPGNYTLPLKMDIPSSLAILQLMPREVEIKVERVPTEIHKNKETNKKKNL